MSDEIDITIMNKETREVIGTAKTYRWLKVWNKKRTEKAEDLLFLNFKENFAWASLTESEIDKLCQR